MRRLMEMVDVDEAQGAAPERVVRYIEEELDTMRQQYTSIGAISEIARGAGNTASAASLDNVQGELAQAIRMLKAALADVGKEL